MKFKDLKAMQKNELNEKLLELKRELIKENAQVAIGTIPKNPGKLKTKKKTIAKIKSLLSKVEEAKKV